MGYKNEISKNLYETQDGLFWKGNLYVPANLNNVVKVLENLSLTDAAHVELMPAVNNGKRLFVTKIDLIPESITNQTSVAKISIGSIGPDYSNILPPYELTGLSDTTFLPIAFNGYMPVIAPNTALILKKQQVAIATSSLISIRILAYYK